MDSFFFFFFSRVFEKSLQYVKRFSRYKNPDAVRQVREYPSNLYDDRVPFPICSYMHTYMHKLS